jgi:NADPH2:quinone reductase
MKAVVCTRWGQPDEVLEVRDRPEPRPGPGEVLVRMLASPINPSDLMMVRGVYGFLPPLPATPGFEGVGVVEEGSGLLAWRVKGKRVAVLNSKGGNWQQKVVIPARNAVPVPDALTDEQAASFFVNPGTALVLTQYVLRIPAGDWLLQTAAGRAEELQRLGGTACIATNEESLVERVQQLTGGEGVRHAIDAVGGATGSEVIRTLAGGGRLIVYGTLSGQPVSFDPRQLMVGQKRVEGFWLSEWVRAQNIATMLLLFHRIGRLMRQGVLTTEVGGRFPLDQIRDAVRQAEMPGRQGKVLLGMEG